MKILKAAREDFSATWLVEVQGHQNVIAYFMRARAEQSAELQSACAEFLSELNAEALPFKWDLVRLPDPL